MRIEYTANAEVDIEVATDQLVDDCGAHVATLFRTRLQATLRKLATMPLAFPLVDPPPTNHPGLRVVPVTKFAARLIFYTPTDAGILVVRVSRAAGDWRATLAD